MGRPLFYSFHNIEISLASTMWEKKLQRWFPSFFKFSDTVEMLLAFRYIPVYLFAYLYSFCIVMKPTMKNYKITTVGLLFLFFDFHPCKVYTTHAYGEKWLIWKAKLTHKMKILFLFFIFWNIKKEYETTYHFVILHFHLSIHLPLIPFIVPPINSYFIIDVENLRQIQIKPKDLKLWRKNMECLDGTTNGKLI